MDRAVADDHRHPVTRRRLERPLRNWMQATFRADYFRRLCGRPGLGLGFGGLVVGIRSHSRVPRCEKAEVLRRARDRKRVVYGKSVSVRVDIGGRRFIQKKKTVYMTEHPNKTT